eukprot:maker-scaffold631_size122145-snap-gene-0.37 protein:Tk01054 transcript:maker-scaffold631_size122145-snap-gene-0.37-mRNA-1 annotation:"hypothetical protein CAPTEDRAFT_219523"
MWALFWVASTLSWAGLLHAQRVKSSIVLERSSLADYELAQCNDGSAAAYFHEDQAGPKAKIMIYLPNDEGLRDCSSAQGCQLKCQEFPQSCSSNERASIRMDDGIWSQETRNNPFATHFKVLLPSCSSDEFGGTRGRSDETGGMIFHGRHIFSSLLRDLVAKHGMGQAQEVVLVGSGSGARGVGRNCDFLADAIKTVNQKTEVKCVLDGVDLVPYWVHDDNCQHAHERPEVQKYLWGRQDDESCIQKHEDRVNSTELASICGTFSRSWKHVETPLFLTSNQLDSQEFKDQTCNLASDAEDFREFSIGWRQGMMAMAEALSLAKPQNGWFIPNCDDMGALLDAEHASMRRQVRIPLLSSEGQKSTDPKTVNVLQAINNWMSLGENHQAIDAFGVPNEACSAVKSLPLDLRPDIPEESLLPKPAPIRAGARSGLRRSPFFGGFGGRFRPPADLFPAGSARTDYIGEVDDFLFDYDEFSLGQDYDYALETGITPGVAAAVNPAHDIGHVGHNPITPVHPIQRKIPTTYPQGYGRTRHAPGRRASLWRRLYYLDYLKKLYNQNFQEYASEYYGTSLGPDVGYQSRKHGEYPHSKSRSSGTHGGYPRHPVYRKSGYSNGARRPSKYFARIQAKEAEDSGAQSRPQAEKT